MTRDQGARDKIGALTQRIEQLEREGRAAMSCYVNVRNQNGGFIKNPITGRVQRFRVQERDPKLGVLVYDPVLRKTYWVQPEDIVESED